jgi:succinyl-diaminopimelate desuccinylase
MSATLELTEQLIARPSVTPDDAGCLEMLGERLNALHFESERLNFGPDNFRVSNLWTIKRCSPQGPTLVFAGHTDVVPTGPLDKWTQTLSPQATAMANCLGVVPVT